MKNKFTKLYLFAFLFVTANTFSQINLNVSPKPFSFTLDNKIADEIISKNQDNVIANSNIEDLLIDAKNPNQEIRKNAILKLGYFSNDNARMLLEKFLLQDTSANIRLSCAQSLGLLHPKKSIPAFIKALNDSSRIIKIHVAFALAQNGEKINCMKFYSELYKQARDIPYYSCHQGFLFIGSPDTKKYLKSDLNNQDPFIAIDAAIILAELGFYSDAFPALKIYLNHSDKYIRMAALRGLAYIGDANSLTLIQSKINDADQLVKERAIFILSKYKGNN